MTAAESKGFFRAAVLLLAVSTLRAGWTAWAPSEPPPVPGPTTLPELLAASDSALDDAQVRARPLAAAERIDPNEADEAQLDRLPGVGAASARAIVATRNERGPFATVEDLLAVPGIGPGTLERIRPSLMLTGPPSGTRRREHPGPGVVDVNRADAPALQALPGIGPALAERILEARRTGGRFRDLSDLQRVRGIGPTTAARLAPRLRFGPGR